MKGLIYPLYNSIELTGLIPEFGTETPAKLYYSLI